VFGPTAEQNVHIWTCTLCSTKIKEYCYYVLMLSATANNHPFATSIRGSRASMPLTSEN